MKILLEPDDKKELIFFFHPKMKKILFRKRSTAKIMAH